MSSEKNLFEKLKRDLIVAGVAGLGVAVCIGIVTILIGQFSGAEARRLVEAMIPTSRLFCSTLMTVGATILALMLTIIGLGNKSDNQLSDAHYHRVVKIAFYDAVLFCCATVLMIVQCIPVYESEKIPSWWYTSIYYGLLSCTAALGGGAVAIISMLYLAVKDLVEVIGLGMEDHRLTISNDKPAAANIQGEED